MRSDLDENWTFQGILPDVEAARTWIWSTGVRGGRGDRIDLLVRDLTSMIAAVEAGQMGKWADPTEFRAAMFTLVEALDLRRVHRAFGDRTDTVMRDKLRRAIKGQRAGRADTPTSADGRNFLAELSFAALFHASGFAVDIDHRPDFLLKLPVVGLIPPPTVAFEVKRPFSPEGVGSCLDDAASQIGRAVTDGVDSIEVVAGVVVIVLDLVIPPFFSRTFGDGDTMRQAQRHGLERWAKENHRLLRRAARPGVAGVALYWRPVGKVHVGNGAEIPVEGRQVRFEGLGFPARDYADVLGGFMGALKP